MKNLLATLLTALFIHASSSAADSIKPNIIVFYTDDHGYADLGLQGSVADIRTPHVDALARSGVLAKHGYSTAPQCVPSRAGLLVGKFQGRFNLDSNGGSLDGFDKETTIAMRLQKAGYVTAQFGKWHLGATEAIPTRGFKHVFSQSGQRPFSANITLDGQDRPMSDLPPEMYHIDGCSRAAASLIERYKNDPFFLYVAYRAPHTPLDAPKSCTDRFPGQMPERRRQALGMISAIDDGVGLITAALKKHGLTERTLIFLIGDNGAPLKIHKTDTPLNGDAGGWDGSLNDPLNGEKGMLAEGGMHVPFVVAWPGTIPGGQTFEHPVSALDVAATAAALADIRTQPGELDGVNLIPHLTGEIKTPPHDALYWRWVAQSAIREGNWKLLRGGDREYLYDLGTDLEEKHNLAATHPDIAARLRGKLTSWSAELNPPGLALGPMAATWNDYFDHYLEGKTIAVVPGSGGKKSGADAKSRDIQGWEARNGTLTEKDGILELTPEQGPRGKSPFLARTQLKLTAPVTAKVTLKSSTTGEDIFAWRTTEQKDFLASNRAKFSVTASEDWQTHELQLPATDTIIHLRLHLPEGTTLLREITLSSSAR
ncbi:MAG: sulfatase-like hydrolase/transferase [Fuerstia sp.]|nr:sulfatase-like hydrolase/transferase [Fuerstiella sp.]